MHIKHTSNLLPGDRLAKTIYTESGQVLIHAKIELTAGIIKRLQALGIDQVYVSDPRTDDLLVEDSVSDETRRRATQAVYDLFSNVIGAKKWNHSISLSKAGTECRKAFEDILYDLQTKKQLMVQLSDIYTTSKFLYSHSVNVGIYSAALGMSLGLNRNQLIELGIGAMLHDIGNTQIRSELFEKADKLTPNEYKEVMEHTRIGYDILRNQPDIPLLSAHCALQHHERLDGSGYPRNLKGDEIHQYGKIVGLVDTYVALVSNRAYRKGYLPHEALDILFASADKYDLDMMATFRNHLVIYPVGMIVRLNTDEKGVVVDVNSKFPHRPIVRILKNQKGESVTPYEVDLSSHRSILISECSFEL